MSAQQTDSPVEWVADHTRRYAESGGDDGHEWRPGVPTLLLTTTGRRTGARRRTPLIYGRAGDAYLVVASRGGHDDHPAWYLNLEAEPRVELQVKDEVLTATARTATDDEKPALWATMAAIWPDYHDYQTRTSRPIPVVVLTPDA